MAHHNQQQMIQWNCQSIRNKKSDLIHLINKYQPFILSFQETWLKPGSIFKIPGYSSLREDRSDGYGGTALFIRRPCNYVHIPIPSHSSNFSIIAVKVNNITFVSLYIPLASSDIINEIDGLLSSIPKPLLILGDLNCQHSSWGSTIASTPTPC